MSSKKKRCVHDLRLPSRQVNPGYEVSTPVSKDEYESVLEMYKDPESTDPPLIQAICVNCRHDRYTKKDKKIYQMVENDNDIVILLRGYRDKYGYIHRQDPAQCGKWKRNALHHTMLELRNKKILQEILTVSPENFINTLDTYGCSALQLCLDNLITPESRQEKELIKVLLNHPNFDPNIEDYDGRHVIERLVMSEKIYTSCGIMLINHPKWDLTHSQTVIDLLMTYRALNEGAWKEQLLNRHYNILINQLIKRKVHIEIDLEDFITYIGGSYGWYDTEDDADIGNIEGSIRITQFEKIYKRLIKLEEQNKKYEKDLSILSQKLDSQKKMYDERIDDLENVVRNS
jgi:hypothetical protein